MSLKTGSTWIYRETHYDSLGCVRSTWYDTNTVYIVRMKRAFEWSELSQSTQKLLIQFVMLFVIVVLSVVVDYFLKNSPSSQSSSIISLEENGSTKLATDQSACIGRRRPEFIPLRYAIGSIDPRFEISKQRVVELAKEAESIWEEPLRRNIFDYDPNAILKINLVFDERQQRNIETKRLRRKMEIGGKSYDALVDEYNRLSAIKEESTSNYENHAASLNASLSSYNSKVEYWNNSGGVPEDQIAGLNRQESNLEFETGRLEEERQRLNNQVRALNTIAEEINALARQHNWDVEIFNGRFVEGRDFEAGVFDGRSINIFEFDEEMDLRFTFAHELGHALGLGHTSDSLSLMFPKLKKQNVANFHLTKADLGLMKRRLALP